MALCLVSFAQVGNKEPQRQKFESHSLQNLMVGYNVSLWLQRNTRLHAEEVKSEEQIIKAIRRDAKAKMEAFKAPASIFHKTLCNNWHILLSTT